MKFIASAVSPLAALLTSAVGYRSRGRRALRPAGGLWD